MISFLPPSSLASSQTTQRMASSRPPPLLSFADNHNFCSFVLLCFCFCFSLLDPHLFMISPLIHCLFCKSCILSSSHSLFDHHFIATNPIQWLLQWRLCVVLGRKWFLRCKNMTLSPIIFSHGYWAVQNSLFLSLVPLVKRDFQQLEFEFAHVPGTGCLQLIGERMDLPSFTGSLLRTRTQTPKPITWLMTRPPSPPLCQSDRFFVYKEGSILL